MSPGVSKHEKLLMTHTRGSFHSQRHHCQEEEAERGSQAPLELF